jgi:hypothetical protein
MARKLRKHHPTPAPESVPVARRGRAHPLAKPLEAYDLALHSELGSRAARSSHQGGDPSATSLSCLARADSRADRSGLI